MGSTAELDEPVRVRSLQKRVCRRQRPVPDAVCAPAGPPMHRQRPSAAGGRGPGVRVLPREHEGAVPLGQRGTLVREPTADASSRSRFVGTDGFPDVVCSSLVCPSPADDAAALPMEAVQRDPTIQGLLAAAPAAVRQEPRRAALWPQTTVEGASGPRRSRDPCSTALQHRGVRLAPISRHGTAQRSLPSRSPAFLPQTHSQASSCRRSLRKTSPRSSYITPTSSQCAF